MPREIARHRKASPRGRPAAELHRNVVRDLMTAAARAIEHRTAEDVSLREIAEAAGTTEAMIQYYFGNKDGLLAAMHDDLTNDTAMVFHPNEIIDSCLTAHSILPLIQIASNFYSERPSLVRMSVIELIRGDSKVNRHYKTRTPMLVHDVIARLIEAEIYRADMNIGMAVASVMALLIYPVSFEHALLAAETKLQNIQNGDWIRFVTQLLDGQFSTKLPASQRS